MSFRIQKSHKFADQFPNDSKKSNADTILTSDDYLLFDLDTKPTSGASARAVAHKGGNYIRPVNSAQADYY